MESEKGDGFASQKHGTKRLGGHKGLQEAILTDGLFQSVQLGWGVDPLVLRVISETLYGDLKDLGTLG